MIYDGVEYSSNERIEFDNNMKQSFNEIKIQEDSKNNIDTNTYENLIFNKKKIAISLFDKLDKEILSINNEIKRNYLIKNVAYKFINKILEIQINQNNLLVTFHRDSKQFDNYNKLGLKKGYENTSLCYCMIVESNEDILYVKKLVQNLYDYINSPKEDIGAKLLDILSFKIKTLSEDITTHKTNKGLVFRNKRNFAILCKTNYGIYIRILNVNNKDNTLNVVTRKSYEPLCLSYKILNIEDIDKVLPYIIESYNISKINPVDLKHKFYELYYSDGYKASDEFKKENISDNIKNSNFTKKRMFNDKYVTSKKWILPDEKDYKYNINWIMTIIVGGFFLYALFFSGMMLARRQIEFLFLFLISPIVFATSIGNKQRRSAVIEQLVSLMLQGAVVMMIIGITVIVMQAINSTTFFSDSNFKDMALKSLMFVGCGTFLLTGSQVVNRFIGSNVSANSGREQLMSLMSYGHALSTATHIGGNAISGATSFELGVGASALGKVGGNKLVNSIGGALQKFGNNIKSNNSPNSNPIKSGIQNGIGNTIEKFGGKVKNSTPSNIGKNMRMHGRENMGEAVSSIMPQRNMYRRRYRNDRPLYRTSYAHAIFNTIYFY